MSQDTWVYIGFAVFAFALLNSKFIRGGFHVSFGKNQTAYKSLGRILGEEDECNISEAIDDILRQINATTAYEYLTSHSFEPQDPRMTIAISLLLLGNISELSNEQLEKIERMIISENDPVANKLLERIEKLQEYR